jgi:Glycosyl transferase family 11
VIAATLVGGLGNQLFQYAAGRSLALRHDTDLVLDRSVLNGSQELLASRRHYELDPFPIEGRTVDCVRSWESHPLGNGIRQRLRRARADYTVLRQRGFVFQRAFFDAPDNTLLVGFWQSEEYFADHAAQIREDLSLPYPAFPQVAHDSSVSLHVRRGDYANDPTTRRVHGLLPVSYFHAALEEIARRIGTAPDVYVFSDDPRYCRDHLDLDTPFSVVDLGAPTRDLCAMSACRHHVIANSSFSWWGAWLDPRPDGIVVAPKQWLSDASVDTSHVVPPRWLRLDAG